MIRCSLVFACIAGSISAQVTFDRLVNSGKEPQNWLTYSGNMMSQRYSPLAQITPENVSRLRPVWVFATGETRVHESPPIVNNGERTAAGLPCSSPASVSARSRLASLTTPTSCPAG